jgi:hypothetical protein
VAQAAGGIRAEEHKRLLTAQVLLTDRVDELAQRSFKLRVAKMPRGSQEAAFVSGPQNLSPRPQENARQRANCLPQWSNLFG